MNSVDRCYRLKLVPGPVFDPDVGAECGTRIIRSRLHAIEAGTGATTTCHRGHGRVGGGSSRPMTKNRKAPDETFGVARGIDFRDVKWVLNVDLPETPMSYTHRVGRTARAGARGLALSLVSIGGRKTIPSVQRISRKAQPLGKSQHCGQETWRLRRRRRFGYGEDDAGGWVPTCRSRGH